MIQNIARFREAIRARRAWRFNINVGIAPDTNINSATDKERIEILGLPFELNPDCRARFGVGTIVAADANDRIRRNVKLPIYLGAYGRMVRYQDGRFNDIYVGSEAGPEVSGFPADVSAWPRPVCDAGMAATRSSPARAAGSISTK